MRQNGLGTLTFEDARTWIEETGLCLFLPGRQFTTAIAPTFVEAMAGQPSPTPGSKQIAAAEEMLVRLENEGVAVRLNLSGQLGEQPDYVVAAWVLPYVYALRGDRDWRRNPQLTGSRQVSPLAVQAYKVLETGDATISQLKQTLGREVSESAVLRAIIELWQQLRIIPVISAVGQPAKWQLLRRRFQKAIAEGASTSQVTAISVLASIYLQAVIAASMEEVEIFLSPLTARSKVREVLRGLVATRQVHTISLGHAPHFYVAGTLPEFAPPPTLYSSAYISASSYYTRAAGHDEPAGERFSDPTPAWTGPPHKSREPRRPEESHASRTPARKPAPSAKTHFSRSTSHSRDRKPASASGSSSRTASSRPARRSDSRPSSSRPQNGSRSASTRWSQNGSKSAHAKQDGHSSNTSSRPSSASARSSASKSTARSAKSGASAWNKRTSRTGSLKAAPKSATAKRGTTLARKDSRSDARPSSRSGSRKPALTAGAKAGNSKRYGFTARPKKGAKKRG